MTHGLRLLIGLGALVAGVPISLVGVLLVLYNGDEGSSGVYIGSVDAHVIGVSSLAVGLTLIWVATRLLRRLFAKPSEHIRRARSGDSS